MSSPGEQTANPAPAAEGSSSSALSDTSLNDLFAPAPAPAAPAAEGAPAQPALGTAPAPVAPAPAAPAPVAPVAPAGTPLAREDITGLRDAIAQLASAPKPGDPPPAADPLTSIPDYNMQMPPQVIEALADPDPAVRGRTLNAVISAVAKTTHAQMYQQMRANLEAVTTQIPQMISRAIQDDRTRTQVTTDFYGKYPQFDAPMLRPVVQLAFVEVIKANPALAQGGWSPALRDAVGEFLKKAVPLAQQAPAVPPKKPAPPAPPIFNGGGARPGTEPALNGQEKEIAEFFG